VKVRIFVEPQQGASYATLLAAAQASEECGFDAFFRSDHFLTMGGDGLPGPTDAWVTLGALARETSRIRLGTLVTSSTFRWPGLLAVTVAQVDDMSGGRVELGLGTGWYDGEHDAYGIPFPPVGERFERLEEQFRILTGLWATPVGETFSFDGAHSQARPAAAPTSHCGRRRAQTDPEAGGHVRRRIQPGLLLSGGHDGAVRPGAGCLRGPGP
jgi:alkanesulfonate monooxygenase SsuD/methylene tetrahydromethanopterin reductase-like flavin-dependent oxidoreductase (luciferase family)